jgi:TRAP-type C4-dicarboxylate transport system permease small subunit
VPSPTIVETVTLYQRIDRMMDSVARGLCAVGVGCVVAMMALTTADVVARYAFNSPTMWADEMASYLLIAIVFLGLAQNLRTNAHIRIDVVTSLVPPGVWRVLEAFAFAVAIVFSFILIAGTWTRFDNFWTRNTLSDSPLMTPMWIAMVPVVIGAVVLGLAAIWGFINSLYALVGGAARAIGPRKE